MNAINKLNSLNDKSAWAYTKQKANFKDLFLSSKLFSNISNKAHTNIEDAFANKYNKYGISTDRHRILAICQMFGLITKSSYYTNSNYATEDATPVFNELLKHNIGSDEYNKILSEQLIKIKIEAIIDTTNYRDSYYIYPFIYLFLVMWQLDKNYGIKKVPINKIYTYVMTCKSMDEINDSVQWIADPYAKPSKYVKQYKSDSRLLTLILENTCMFSYDDELLSLNHPIADDFYNNFILKNNLTGMYEFLKNDAKYRVFLTNLQNFDFDLTKNVNHSNKNKPLVTITISGNQSSNQNEVEEIIDSYIDLEEEKMVVEASTYDNQDEIDKSNNRIPSLKEGYEQNKRYTTDPKLAKTAIKNAGFTCELCSKIAGSHSTFVSTYGTNYAEAHHLVPMKAQKDFISLGVNLDRLENIVSLCPTCHKAIHYGAKDVKKTYLKPLYDSRISKLKAIGIDIDFDVLVNDYY